MAGGQDAGDRPSPGSPEWLKRAEELIVSLTGVVSTRVVVDSNGRVQEIHVLATDEATPKQTVRNVQSALMAQLDTRVDHRKISIAPLDSPSSSGAQQSAGVRAPPAPPTPGPRKVASPVEPRTAPDSGDRILFMGHGVDSVRSQRLRLRVALAWKGDRLVGECACANLIRPRMEGFACATLRGLEQILDPDSTRVDAMLSLDGVRVIKAFERQFVVVVVSAFLGGRHTALTGAAAVGDSLDRAVILATLQATDRRVRAFVGTSPDRTSATAQETVQDLFDAWE